MHMQLTNYVILLREEALFDFTFLTCNSRPDLFSKSFGSSSSAFLGQQVYCRVFWEFKV